MREVPCRNFVGISWSRTFIVLSFETRIFFEIQFSVCVLDVLETHTGWESTYVDEILPK